MLTLTRHQWGKGNAAYRRIFSQSLMPDATGEELDWFDEFQRLAISPENAVRYQEAMAEFDLRSRLAAVAVPTLVVHSRDDLRVPLEHGRELAAAIPAARFVTLPSRNHIVVSREPAWPVMMAEIEAFLAEVEKNGR